MLSNSLGGFEGHKNNGREPKRSIFLFILVATGPLGLSSLIPVEAPLT